MTGQLNASQETVITALRNTGISESQITSSDTVPARPVGGLTLPTNKLEILTPYLELAGLVIGLSAVVVRKRRD